MIRTEPAMVVRPPLTHFFPNGDAWQIHSLPGEHLQVDIFDSAGDYSHSWFPTRQAYENHRIAHPERGLPAAPPKVEEEKEPETEPATTAAAAPSAPVVTPPQTDDKCGNTLGKVCAPSSPTIAGGMPEESEQEAAEEELAAAPGDGETTAEAEPGWVGTAETALGVAGWVPG